MKKSKSTLETMTDSYNKMWEDPKEYANTTYKQQIQNQGRPYGGDRDARTKAVKKWNRGDIPV